MDPALHHVTTLFDLPQDILDWIFPYLPPKSFLAFCSVNKEIYERFHLDPLYWRVRTSNTFRLPISPLLHADGARWAWLYKKLRTQTRPFTWGKGVQGGLGPSTGLRNPQTNFKPRGVYPRTTSSWPTEVYVRAEDGDIIVDLQCGGWSTSILTNDGRLFTVGILDATDMRETGKSVEYFTRLQMFAQHSISGVRQFSAGRCHILALDDNGYVWSWDRTDRAGCLLSFQNSLDYLQQATRVVAGWADSSAYIPGKGIVYWPYISTRLEQEEQAHERLVVDILIPATGYRRPEPSEAAQGLRDGRPSTEGELTGEDVGEVLAHIVLEGYVVFITHYSKLFACRIGQEARIERQTHFPVLEIPGYSGHRELKDLQGSFRTFSVFSSDGAVLSGNTGYLNMVFDEARLYASRGVFDASNQSSMPYSEELLASRPPDIPALQNSGVIALAFGDYHSHALHANGTITAHGVEPGCCGALGLGSTSNGARFRGVKTSRTPMNRDAVLLPIAKRSGRQVWFEHEKRDWLGWMESWIRTPTALPHYPEIFAVLNEQPDKQEAFSEWVEQEGRHWSDGPAVTEQVPSWGSGGSSTDGAADLTDRMSSMAIGEKLPAYFAISVAAAGHHSGALVLVDDEQAEMTRKKWIADERNETGNIKGEYIWEKRPFPRIKLPNGYEFPGEGSFAKWRDGMPTTEQLGLEPPVH